MNTVEPAHSLFGRESHPLDVFFRPRSVAVIGATENAGSVGRTTLWNLISSPFGGTVYPVNPKRKSVLGVRAHATVKDVPEPVDLAVIVTPAASVPAVVRECVEARVKGAIILAAGFREMGPEGEALERQVLDEARQGSIRIVGPNCLGVMSPHTGLNATFASALCRPGNVAFLSQSGALGTAVLDWSQRELVGFSAFVSIGSMADVGWGDLIDYLGNDPRTRSILLYMESIGDPGAFLSAAREVTLSKPIIVIKAGRTLDGARAAAAHTGALTGNDEVLDAAFRRCGVLRVNQVSDLFYIAEVLGKQPRPRGKRLTIVTNAGGPGVLAADTLISNGGALAPLQPETHAALSQLLPREWSRINPIDILGDATPERYAKAVDIVSKDDTSDAYLVILAPQAMTDPTATAELLRPFAKIPHKPLLTSWMGGNSVSAGAGVLQAAEIPCFPYPDTAARMFLHMWHYSENLRAIYETPLAEEFPLVSPAILDGKDSLTSDELASLLESYEIAVPHGSGVSAGSYLDPQFGPVVFLENEVGIRGVGLPPLTSTLAGLMLECLPGCFEYTGGECAALERLALRTARLVVEQPRIAELRVSQSSASIRLLPQDAPLPKPAIRPYPTEYVTLWRMKNGDQVTIRPIRAEDEPLLVRFHEALSERTVYFRYLSALKLSTRIAHERLTRICFIDYARQMALVVERNSEIIAVGRLSKDPQAYARGRREAEFALVVADSWQGQGIGKELLLRIIDIARKEDVELLYGEISAENQTMQAICRAMGFRISRDIDDTTVSAKLTLA